MKDIKDLDLSSYNNALTEFSWYLEDRYIREDEMCFFGAKRLEAKYLSGIASLELELDELNHAIKRAEEELDMINFASGVCDGSYRSAIDVEAIEAKLDARYKELEAELDRRKAEIEEADKFYQRTEDARLAYHQIVRCRHPRLVLNNTEEKKVFFEEGREAYKNLDVEKLRRMSEAIADEETSFADVTNAYDMKMRTAAAREEYRRMSDVLHKMTIELHEKYPKIYWNKDVSSLEKMKLEVKLVKANKDFDKAMDALFEKIQDIAVFFDRK